MKLLTVSQAAERLNLSDESVRKLADSGRLLSVRPMGPRGHRRIVDESIDSYIEQLAVGRDTSEPIVIAKPSGGLNLSAVLARGKTLTKGVR